MNQKFNDAGELSIDCITGSAFSRFFFLVSPNNQKISILDGSIDGDNPTVLPSGSASIPVGPAPGKVAVQVATP